MATAGYETVIYIGGTATTMTDEACTQVSAGPPQVFRITDASKRALDPDTAILIEDDADVDVTDDFTIDYPSGVFTSATGGHVSIKVTGKFIPLLAVAEGRSTSASPTAAELDSGIFGEAFSKAIQGKKGASGEIAILAPLDQDLDTGGGTHTWQAVFDGDTRVLIDTRLIPTSTVRAWTILPGLTSKSDQAGLVENSIRWRSISKKALDGTECGFTVFDPTA